MTQELIYTSAPRGLKPGTQGFCTVVSTQGMPVNLAMQLEALSGYRHLFPPGDPQEHRNPVAYSHWLLQVGGQAYHVVSRIGAAGVDYSRRSNKLAHHVVLRPEELPPSGPAWLLSQPDFMERQWDGRVRLLPRGRPVPRDPGPIGSPVCSQWQQITGDAGWAGLLAETALTGQPAVLVVPVGMDPLPLLAEALALLPPESRWKVTFTTYYTGLPTGLQCQWRCVVQGTPEELPARRTRGALVLDLTRPLGPAPDAPASQAARQAQPIPLPAPEPTLSPRIPPSPQAPLQAPEAIPEGVHPSAEPPPSQALSVLPGATVPPPVPVPPAVVIYGFGRKRSKWLWVGGAIAVVLLLLMTISIPLLVTRLVKIAPEETTIAQAPAATPTTTPPSTPSDSIPPASPSAEKKETESEKKPEKQIPPFSKGKTEKTEPPTSEKPAEKSAPESPDQPSSAPKPKKKGPPGSGPSAGEDNRPKPPPARKTGNHPPPKETPATPSPPLEKPEKQEPALRKPKRYWLQIPEPVAENLKTPYSQVVLDRGKGPAEERLALEFLMPEQFQEEYVSRSSGSPQKIEISVRSRTSGQEEPVATIVLENGAIRFQWRKSKHWEERREILEECLLLVKDLKTSACLAIVQFQKPVTKDAQKVTRGEPWVPLDQTHQGISFSTKIPEEKIFWEAYLWDGKEKRPFQGSGKLRELTLQKQGVSVRILLEKIKEQQTIKLQWKGKLTSPRIRALPSESIPNLCKRLENLKTQTTEKIKQMAETTQQWSKQPNPKLEEEKERLEKEKEGYEDLKRILEASQVQYSFYHTVKDSQGKEYRVYIGFTKGMELPER